MFYFCGFSAVSRSINESDSVRPLVQLFPSPSQTVQKPAAGGRQQEVTAKL